MLGQRQKVITSRSRQYEIHFLSFIYLEAFKKEVYISEYWKLQIIARPFSVAMRSISGHLAPVLLFLLPILAEILPAMASASQLQRANLKLNLVLVNSTGRLRTVEVSRSQQTVNLQCPMKKCCKHAMQKMPQNEDVLNACKALEHNVEWQFWSKNERDWRTLPEELITARRPGVKYNNSRVSVLTKRSVKYYRCIPLQSVQNFVHECQPHVTRVKRTPRTSQPQTQPIEKAATSPVPPVPVTTVQTMPKTPHPKQRRPYFKQYPEEVLLVNSGSIIVLACQAAGYPKPVTSWLRGYKPINVAGDRRLALPSDGSLRISDVRKSDQDTYRCVARSPVGYIVATSEVWIR